MSLLAILYWVILVLSAVGAFAPTDWTYAPRVHSLAGLVLFILIGLKIFRTSLS
jgi:hypothetical protein